MACLHRRCDETRQFCLVSKFCSHRRQDSLVSSRPSFDECALAVWTQLEMQQNCLVLSLIVLTRQDETVLSRTHRRCEQAITLLCLLIVSVVGKGFCVGMHKVWNSLSDSCKHADLIYMFTSRLKSKLFDTTCKEHQSNQVDISFRSAIAFPDRR